MDTKELIKKIHKIEIKSNRLSNNIFSGEYHSSFKGMGMTFDEVRKYQYGDDIRSIDWNTTARYREPYIKIFKEEREQTLMLAVDISGSGLFGSINQFKKEMILEICATLAFSAIKNNDKVGLLLFTDKVEKFIPPKKGKNHVLRIIRELIEFKPSGSKTSINEAIGFLSNILKRKSITFILSDFDSKNYENNLKVLATKHDVTGIRIYDKMDETLPNLGVVQIKDLEQNKTISVNTSSRRVRKDYAKNYAQSLAYFQENFKKSGAGKIEVGTHESYVKKLISYFKNR